MNRRAFLATAAAAAAAQESPSPIVDTHIHLFSPDQSLFPYHANAPYRPDPLSLDDYLAFVAEAGITHTVIVHPEPYQDNHTYLEYCFLNEPSKMFFKGTCLFDPTDEATPDRMAKLVERLPHRIIALRIHSTRERGSAPTTSGAIRNRDLTHPMVRRTIRAAHNLGLAIQFNMTPVHAPQVAFLAAEFSRTHFIIDHLANSAAGTPAEYAQVLEMAHLPNVIMKFSGLQHSSSEDYPYRDTRALVRHTYQAFGPERMIWGGLGHNMDEWRRQRKLFEDTFAFIDEATRAKIRGGNAMRLFWS